MINWLEKNRIISANASVLIAILIFLFSSIPGNSEVIPDSFPFISYFYHFIIFFAFSFFLFAAIKGKRKINSKFIFLVLSVVFLYALLDEVHQMFVPLRNPSLLDLLVDLAGSSIAITFYSSLENRRNRKKK